MTEHEEGQSEPERDLGTVAEAENLAARLAADFVAAAVELLFSRKW